MGKEGNVKKEGRGNSVGGRILDNTYYSGYGGDVTSSATRHAGPGVAWREENVICVMRKSIVRGIIDFILEEIMAGHN